jgi:uncharacterized protein YndB with AHSA1/START domain
MNDFGTVTEPGTVRLERLLPGPIERVWAFLTEPEKRRRWLATGPMELRVGGRVALQFNHAELSEEQTPEKYRQNACAPVRESRITRCEKPRLLAFTWGSGAEPESEVTFELTVRGEKVLLTLTHRRLADRASMVSVAGGWHIHLAILTDILEGRPPRPFWSTYTALDKEYQSRISPA